MGKHFIGLLVLVATVALAAPAVAQHAEDPHDHGSDHGKAAASDGHASDGHGHGADHGLHAPPPLNWFGWDFKTKDTHGGTLEKGEEHMGPPVLFALINFGLFVGLLVWKAGPGISSWLESRHTGIKDALAEAAILREQAAGKLDEYNKRIADVNDDVEKLMVDIRAEAELEKTKVLEAAGKQAAALKRAADERIEAEIARAKTELQREVITAAASAAERALREKTTPADHRALVAGFITDLNLGTTTADSSDRLDEDWF